MSELLRAQETANLLNLSVSQVYSMAKRGELPAVTFGGKAVRFPREELEAWIRGRIRCPIIKNTDG